MSRRYRTAKRGTTDFEQLITGSFSRTERALPIQSLRVGKSDEEVTFEIVPRSKIPSMPLGAILKSFLPIKKILFVLFPLFFFVIRDWNRPFLSSVEVLLIFLGTLLALLAVQIRIDSEDFISGYDRIRGAKGQAVLSDGVYTVAELKGKTRLLLSVAVVLGVVPLLLEPFRMISFTLAILFFYVGYKKGVIQKNRFVRDIYLALIAGPCLAYGIVPKIESLEFGLVWSLFVFYELQLEHFQFYFAQTEAGEKNLMTLFSFDQAKKVLWATWGVALIGFTIYRALYGQLALWIGFILILTFISLKWRSNLYALATPAGSQIDRVCEKGHHLNLTFISLWVVELLFQAFVAPLVFAWFK